MSGDDNTTSKYAGIITAAAIVALIGIRTLMERK